MPEPGTLAEWEDFSPIDSGLSAIFSDIRVGAGKCPEGIWVRVSGPVDQVMGALSGTLQDHSRTILGEHLE